MSGVTIQVEIKDQEVRAAFGKLEALMQNTTPIMRAIGTALVETTHQRFQTATDPQGAPWKPLKPAYALTKRGPGILRQSGMRGGLMGSITYRAGRDSVEVGSNKIYAAIHQFGGRIVPRHGKYLVFRMGGQWVHARSVTIPARPYLGIGRRDEEAVLDVLETAIEGAIVGAKPAAKGNAKL